MDKDKVVEIVEEFSGYLGQIYKFGFYELEDMKQEAVLRCLEALNNNNYDETKSLKQYLFMVVKNHFKNLLRKYRQKNEPPCLTCPFFDAAMKSSDNQCTKFINKNDCKEFSEFQKKCSVRESILSPHDIGSLSEIEKEQLTVEYDILENMADTELYLYIDEHLKPYLRSDFLRLLSGINIKEENKKIIQREVALIIRDGGFEITYINLDNFIGDDE